MSADETALLVQGVKLLNDGLGQGYYDLESLRKWCTDGAVYAAVDPDADILAGIMNVKMFGGIPDAPFESYADRGPVGFLKSLVVHPDYRGQGLGKRLNEVVFKWFREQGARTLVTLSWESGSAQSSLKMLQSLGFQVDRVMKAYWYQDSLTHNFGCPVCGDPPCRCDAYLCSRNEAAGGHSSQV